MAAYQRPGFFTAHIINPIIEGFVRLGLSLRGAQVLAVRGRASGKWRTTPVNPVTVGGQRYLVAPRGDTHWARNLRASGEGVLRVGRRSQPIRATEVSDADKPSILRAYLRRWRAETGKFFGVSEDPSDEELARVAPDHPVFCIGP